MPAFVVDGQDVLDVYQHARDAVQRARKGEGPTFLECKTYRYYGHFLGDDPHRYRTVEEETYYRSRDCIERLLGGGALAENDAQDIQLSVEELIDEAVRFAESSPLPRTSELTTQVYS
jgi:pyruvate dehydrogenase E1 component alpha subunit